MLSRRPTISKKIIHLWHGIVAEDPFQHGDGSADYDVIADVLHNGRRLARDQRQ